MTYLWSLCFSSLIPWAFSRGHSKGSIDVKDITYGPFVLLMTMDQEANKEITTVLQKIDPDYPTDLEMIHSEEKPVTGTSSVHQHPP